ncbi:hypothetical protein PsorP6_018190 [Peronosclerospora sorghi]|uniref:Uncharacterized protein n=1 Tax=Peronosclerospora sorghi TaxID=230839 RepID=A0ACC0WDY5_9STRA|nr:hypothetical protein PsorP6_018190 [Peronosclerospora sorghi]
MLCRVALETEENRLDYPRELGHIYDLQSSYRIDRLAPELNEMLKINGIVVEYQDSLNTCATFNILNVEERRVAAELLPYDPECA